MDRARPRTWATKLAAGSTKPDVPTAMKTRFAKSSCTTVKGFLSPWRRFFGLDCMLIRRSAKMLAENVDCVWPGFKKGIWLAEKQLLNLRCHLITMV
jgi:hypothetical protein